MILVLGAWVIIILFLYGMDRYFRFLADLTNTSAKEDVE